MGRICLRGRATASRLRELSDQQIEWQPAATSLLAEKRHVSRAAKRALAALEHATRQIDVDLPEFEMPAAEPDDDGPEPLVSSEMDLEEHIRVLRARKQYSEEQ
jgi:hypothetical protein